MEFTSVIIALFCVTQIQISFSQERQCSVVVSRNVTNPAEISFYNTMEEFIKQEKIVIPIRDYLNAGRLDVFMMYSVDYNETVARVKLENITLETDSNNSDPDFFKDEYHNTDINNAITNLKNLLNVQNNTSFFETFLSDEVINSYLQKMINCNMNVHATVTSQEIYINYIEVQYDGRNGCSLLSDDIRNQRHKRSSDNARQDRNLHERLQRVKHDDHKSIINNGLSARSISLDEDCSDKRSATIIQDEDCGNDDNYNDEYESARRGILANQPVCDHDLQTPMRRNMMWKTDSECLLTKAKDYILNLTARLVKYMYIQITRLIDMFLGVDRTDDKFRRYFDQVLNRKKFSPEKFKKEVLPDIHTYLKRTSHQIATKLINEMDNTKVVTD